MLWALRWINTYEVFRVVFLLGKSHGQRSLVDYSPWGRTELHMTEHTHTHLEWNWYATALLRLLPVHHICYIFFIYNLTWSPRFQEDSLVSPLYRWGNWGLENLSSLIRLTQVICDSVRLDFKAPSGFPWWLRWEIIFLQCRRPRFHPWVWKIPLEKKNGNPL